MQRIELPPRVKDLSTQRFGNLTCLFPIERRANGHTAYACACECGSRVYATCSNLKYGHTTSCGCHQKQVTGDANRTHGMKGTKTYQRWCQMIQRCHKPYAHNYEYYGGRGIEVCARWHRFENFLADMGEAPQGLWIERVDNDGPYSPENCVWAYPSEQMANTRRTKSCLKIESNGVVRSLREWGTFVGVGPETIRKRLDRGWSTAEALGTS